MQADLQTERRTWYCGYEAGIRTAGGRFLMLGCQQTACSSSSLGVTVMQGTQTGSGKEHGVEGLTLFWILCRRTALRTTYRGQSTGITRRSDC